MKKKKVLIGILLLSVIITGSLLFFTGKISSGESNLENSIPFVEALPGSVSITVEGPAFIEPYETRIIRSAIEGSVIFIAREGERVEAGEILLSFDRTEKERSLQQSQINLSKAELNRDRNLNILDKARESYTDSEELYKGGALSREQVDGAEAVLESARFNYEAGNLEVMQAQLALDMAREDLEKIHIRAPFSGVVLSSDALNGDLVNRGSTLLVFADLNKVRLRAEVDEFDIGKVEPGQKVSISSDSLGDEVIGSIVESVSPSAEIINNISIFNVTTVLENEEGRLKVGMSADLSILISSDKGLVVPSKAVTTVRTRSYIKVLEDAGEQSRRVTTGSDDGINTVVLDGLEEGEKVILPAAPGFQLGTPASTSSGTSVIPVSIPGSGGK